MAAGLTRKLMEDRSIEVTVASGGTISAGAPATDEAIQVMAARGIDIEGHVSRKFDDVLQDEPEIVIALAREHALEVVDWRPDLCTRTFTLKELARRSETLGERREDQSIADYLAPLSAGRNKSDLTALSRKDDVSDPIGRSRRRYEKCADELEILIGQLVQNLWPRP